MSKHPLKKKLHWRLHMDNAPIHRSKLVQAFLSKKKVTKISHPAYSPDLSPCDFYLFAELKKWACGRNFASVKDAAKAATTFLTDMDKRPYKRAFDSWPERCQKVYRSKGAFLR
jgi:hypothetical protein